MDGTHQKPSDLPFWANVRAFLQKWSEHIPAEIRPQFEQDVASINLEHDRQIKALQGVMERAEKQQGIDDVTNLLRKKPIIHGLQRILEGKRDADTKAVGVLFVDMNKFKLINDKLGHKMGDKALRTVASVIKDTIRIERKLGSPDSLIHVEQDLSAPAEAGRYGGDEFLICLKLQTLVDVELVALRLYEALRDKEKLRSSGWNIEKELPAAVGGVAFQLPESIDQIPVGVDILAAALIDQADKRMYHSKKHNKVYIAYVSLSEKEGKIIKTDRQVALPNT